MADGRGGRRAGQPGRAYPNRSDMNGPLPVRTPTGLPYGQAKELSDLQRAGRPAPPPAPRGQVAPSAGMGAPPSMPGPLHRPSERPHEPITTGLSTGPGPGPDALGLGVDAGEYARIAQYLPVLELIASRPGASEMARNFVRRVRGSIRPGEL